MRRDYAKLRQNWGRWLLWTEGGGGTKKGGGRSPRIIVICMTGAAWRAARAVVAAAFGVTAAGVNRSAGVAKSKASIVSEADLGIFGRRFPK